MNEPEEKPAPEIRGGDRPEDYIPVIPPSLAALGAVEADGEFTGWFEKNGCPGHEDDEPLGGNDPDTQ